MTRLSKITMEDLNRKNQRLEFLRNINNLSEFIEKKFERVSSYLFFQVKPRYYLFKMFKVFYTATIEPIPMKLRGQTLFQPGAATYQINYPHWARDFVNESITHKTVSKRALSIAYEKIKEQL